MYVPWYVHYSTIAYYYLANTLKHELNGRFKTLLAYAHAVIVHISVSQLGCPAYTLINELLKMCFDSQLYNKCLDQNIVKELFFCITQNSCLSWKTLEMICLFSSHGKKSEKKKKRKYLEKTKTVLEILNLSYSISFPI